MTIVPVLLDQRPEFLGPDGPSLLLMPTADGVLGTDIARSVQQVTGHRPYVFPEFAPDRRYEEQLRALAPGVQVLDSPSRFGELVADLDPSHQLLLVSPERYPAAGLDLRALCTPTTGQAGIVTHLVAVEESSVGTRELVQTGDDGRLRRIQRYFAPVTWPFPAGVLASLVPVSCLTMLHITPYGSLAEVRRALSAAGMPARDLPLRGESLDLADEATVLAFMERRVLEAMERGEQHAMTPAAERLLRSRHATIHPAARLVGPVVVHARAVVEQGALVIGPAIIGEGARIAQGAIVAQCLVLPDAVVVAGTTLRHRVVSRADRGGARAQRRHLLTAPITGATERASIGRRRYLALRGLIEPLVALVALVLLAPLFVVTALLTRLDSPGPLFYGDRREGRDGREFRCWKFRTMRANADAMQGELAPRQQMDGPQFKMLDDPRVTRVGRWLRRLNLDELPQLWNVARGEMSFVGPRPSPFRENQICVPWRNGRLSVNPGITGLWQVCRHDRLLGDFHQWIHYDLLYVRNVSARVDLRILAATMLTLGGRRPVSVSRIIAQVLALAMLGGPAAAAQLPRGAAPTQFFVSADAGLERNPHLRVDDDSAPDQTASVRAGVLRYWTGPRGAVALLLSGETVNYQVGRELNRATYDVLLDAQRVLTPRVTGHAGAQYRTVLSTELYTAGGITGVPGGAAGQPDLALPPLGLARSASGWADVARRMSVVTTGSARVTYSRVTFDSPVFLPGEALTGRAELRRRYAADDAMLVRLDAQHGRSQGVPLDAQSVAMGWEPSGRRASLRVLAGVTHSAHPSGSRVTPTGSAEVRQTMGTGGVSVRYERAVSQAYGLGQLVVSDAVSAGYEHLSRSNIVRLTGARSRNTDPVASDAALTATHASLELRHLLSSGLSFGTIASYRGREGRERVSGSGVRLLVAYGVDDR